jgi:hypothetical protein
MFHKHGGLTNRFATHLAILVPAGGARPPSTRVRNSFNQFGVWVAFLEVRTLGTFLKLHSPISLWMAFLVGRIWNMDTFLWTHFHNSILKFGSGWLSWHSEIGKRLSSFPHRHGPFGPDSKHFFVRRRHGSMSRATLASTQIGRMMLCMRLVNLK